MPRGSQSRARDCDPQRGRGPERLKECAGRKGGGGWGGLHAHRNAARHVDDLNAEGEWAAKTVKRAPQQSAQPPVRRLLGPASAPPHATTRHHTERRPQRPTERSDPTQHAKGRTGDCPGPRKGTATQRNVTRGEGGAVVCEVGGGGGCGGEPSGPYVTSPPPRPCATRQSQRVVGSGP